MSIIIQKLLQEKAKFFMKDDVRENDEVMRKITNIINHLGKNFNTLNGGELAECQIKLAGFKFYLADGISNLMCKAEFYKAYLKEQRSKRWSEIETEIKDRDGRVKNKEQIENVLNQDLYNETNEQIFYEAEFYRAKIKSYAIDDILTCCVQRIAQLKREVESAKHNSY